MTVSTEVTRVIVEGNAVATSFSYTFPIPGSTATDQTNAELILLGTDSSITTLADNLWSMTGVGTDVGGTFVYNPGSPLTTGAFLVLNRIVPYLQPTELGSQGAYSPTVVMAALDNLAFQTEQLNTRALQAVRAPITDAALSDLPTADLRANSFLFFDDNGDVTTASETGGMPSAIFVGNTASTTTFLTQTLILDGFTLSNVGATTTASGGGGGGGGSLTITDGSNTVSAATKLTFQNGTVGGTTPNATYTAPSSGTGGASTPQGRLTLTAATPVMTADVSTSSTIYYCTYQGNQVPVWDGSTMASLTIGSDQISTGLDSSFANSGAVFDIFGILDSGVLKIGYIGWTSTTGRGTGGVTCELTLQSGVWVNKNAITIFGGAIGQTNFTVAAKKGTYLGTFLATANGQTSWVANPVAANNGGNCKLALWNAYNRVLVTTAAADNTSSWTYGTATWRPVNNSLNNRITYVDGLALSFASSNYSIYMHGVSGGVAAGIGVNQNSTTATPNIVGQQADTDPMTITVIGSYPPHLGLNYLQAMEWSSGSSSVFSGQNASIQVMQLMAELPM